MSAITEALPIDIESLFDAYDVHLCIEVQVGIPTIAFPLGWQYRVPVFIVTLHEELLIHLMYCFFVHGPDMLRIAAQTGPKWD